MHVVAWRCCAASRSPAKLVTTRRKAYRSVRKFHCSQAARLSVVPPPAEPPKTGLSADAKEQYQQNGGPIASNTERLGSIIQTSSENAEPRPAAIASSSRPREKSSDHGSYISRSQRNLKPDGIPAVVIPEWFLRHNVRLKEACDALSDNILRVNTGPGKSHRIWRGQKSAASSDDSELGQAAALSDSSVPSEGGLDLMIHEKLWEELCVSVIPGLQKYHSTASESLVAQRTHLNLHCPIDGHIYFLDTVVEELAQREGADLIRLDAQDLAYIGGDYIRESSDASSNTIWSLGYDAHHVLSQPNESDSIESEDVDDSAEASNDYADGNFPHSPSSLSNFRGPFQVSSATMIPFSIGSNLGELRRVAEKAMALISPIGSPSDSRGSRRNSLSSSLIPSSTSRQWQDQKITTLLESLIDVAAMKREKLPEQEAQPSGDSENFQNTQDRQLAPSLEHSEIYAQTTSETAQHRLQIGHMPANEAFHNTKTIIHIRGYKEIEATQQGNELLDRLNDVVQNRRKRGECIMVIGTTSSADLTPELSVEAVPYLQSEGSDDLYRTIFVSPDTNTSTPELYEREKHLRVREINFKNLTQAIRRARPNSNNWSPIPRFRNFDAIPPPYLQDRVLTFGEIHRIVTTSLGICAVEQRETGQPIPIQISHLTTALDLLADSDKIKREWVEKERKVQMPSRLSDQTKATPAEARLKMLKQMSSNHERKLLGGVIDPDNIQTTFDDVHVPPETIEALHTLTTLSLTRPDAFKYGVLATDKISGLLLYGPPGTGKTLLAKAVAKESGATVLEVSGSEIYDMYVGESEKNVKAIFSLAEKLSPCVVFIDEADAVFGSRGSTLERKTHREIINQFLREWDGMNQLSAFIMVATNRPFDLDDAILRRLPRRLLVELPVEKDREAILRIHLKNETLDPSVSLAKLAAETPLYSGSDLKNLAVAAALACVREESADAAAKEKDISARVYPEKRILMQRHFDKAMEEISASVSEDMSSLSAIKKFDEKYGDRRGRRKKHVYGFVTGTGEKAVDAARVRA